LSRILAAGLYLIVLGAGSLTLATGCGGGGTVSNEITEKPREATEQEKQARQEAMKEAMKAKAANR